MLRFFGEVEAIVGSAVVVCWGLISAIQLLRAKLQTPKCIICDRSVAHNEQSTSFSVPCHERCRFLGELLANNLIRTESHVR
jgi:hypothetical protein